MKTFRVVALWVGLVVCGLLAMGFGLLWAALALVDMVGAIFVLPFLLPSWASVFLPLVLAAFAFAGVQWCWKALRSPAPPEPGEYDLIPRRR